MPASLLRPERLFSRLSTKSLCCCRELARQICMMAAVLDKGMPLKEVGLITLSNNNIASEGWCLP